MNTLTKNIFISLALAASLTACGGSGNDKDVDYPDVVTVAASKQKVEFPAAGGSETLEVTSFREWDAVTSEAWIKIAKSGSLETKGTITLTAGENSATKERAGEVLLMSGSHRFTVSVVQAGREPEPVDGTITPPDGYSLVWHDEFDGTSLNKSDWTHEVQGPGWVNNELQTYVNGSFDGKPVTEVSDGTLKINCFKQGNSVYSGRIYAKVGTGWTYGVFEARIKLPKGKGTWPAFWMMPVNNDFGKNPWPKCGEIDIMEEVGYHPDYTSSSIHCESYNHVQGTQRTAERLTKGAEGEFHMYRLEWTKDYIKTYVDGNPLLTFENDGRGQVSTWPFNKPFYLILNLAWGGSWGGAQGVNENALPVTMEVDYVRVFQKN